MANKTKNYGLTKPTLEEFYDVNVQNENMDKIDEELKKRAILDETGKVPSDQLPDMDNVGATPILLTSKNDLNQITTNGFYYWRTNNKPINAPTDEEASQLTAMRVWSEDGITCIQEIMDMYSGNTHSCVMRRTVDDGEGYPWEWVNPPMTIGVEYRTVERYDNEPVFVTLLSSGVVQKRTDYHGIVAPKTETWTFTLEDGSTVTKAVYVG